MTAKILIVEDEAIVALDIKNSLIKLGYQVTGICPTGQDAIKKCSQLKPEVVLMDIRLKGELDGIETATILQQDFSLPIIYLTAHADSVTLERAKVTEPYGYILKPFRPVELRVALELTLFKKYQLSSPLADQPPKDSDDLQFESSLDRDLIIKNLLAEKLFAGVARESIEQMLTASHLEKFSAGQQLVFEGDERLNGFLVLSGRLAFFKSSFSGRELVVELIRAFDMFGLAVAIENQPYTFSVKAQIDCSVLYVTRKGILDLLEKEAALYRRFIALIAARLSAAHDTARSLAHDKADVRIVTALLNLSPSCIDSKKPTIHLTRKELADLTGTTIETAIRTTKKMEKAGLLDLSQHSHIKITDREKLSAYLEQFI